MARQSETVGGRIRRYRDEGGLSLADLSERASVAKGYLSTLENEPEDGTRRPSGNTLSRIAQALGVTVGDLLGEPEPSASSTSKIPASLREFARSRNLPESDLQMLAKIQFRGRQPQTAEGWLFIYDAIQMSAEHK